MVDPNPLHRALCCGPTCGRGSAAQGPCVAGTYGAAIEARLNAANYVAVRLDAWDRRITELLEANNREVLRRRAAEAQLAKR